jgi:hypothetical protein
MLAAAALDHQLRGLASINQLIFASSIRQD